MNEIQKADASVIENVIIQGNLANLTPEQRVQYYMKTCESLGLNPMTKPFDYISLNGKLTLYAKRDATDQLRKLNKVSIIIDDQKITEGVFLVTVSAKLPDGRIDSEVGAVPVAGLKGEAMSNAIMKAITKAKRRVTLSICGLGWTDESEIDSIPGASKSAPDLCAAPNVAAIVPSISTREAENTEQRTVKKEPITPKQEQLPMPASDPGQFVIPYGRDKGKKICEVSFETSERSLIYWENKAKEKPVVQDSNLDRYMKALEAYLNQVEKSCEPPSEAFTESDIPF